MSTSASHRHDRLRSISQLRVNFVTPLWMYFSALIVLEFQWFDKIPQDLITKFYSMHPLPRIHKNNALKSNIKRSLTDHSNPPSSNTSDSILPVADLALALSISHRRTKEEAPAILKDYKLHYLIKNQLLKRIAVSKGEGINQRQIRVK